jgi:nicotinamide mononucleotide (NMN) deamidase PncC
MDRRGVCLERVQKLEAIVENTLKKYGSVSDALAQELADAQTAYAVAKDDYHEADSD